MNKTFPLIAVAAVAAITLTGCGLNKMSQPFNDAPRSANEDDSAAQIITMPDGFSNLATKCVGGIRYTVAFHNDAAYGAVSTVADPKCNR